MSYGRALVRKIDTDLVNRIEANGKPLKHKQPRKNAPRPSGSYRGARRNEAQALRQGGKRHKMITYTELLRINAMAARNRKAAEQAAA
jgi:hypothetical protein